MSNFDSSAKSVPLSGPWPGDDKAFKEEQKFPGPAIWGVTSLSSLAVFGFFGWGCFRQLVLKIPFGNHPVTDKVLIETAMAMFAAQVGLVAILLSLRLVTKVDPESLKVQLMPLQMRPVEIQLRDIESAEAVEYNPLLDYGGWGIRYGRAGKAYNATGNRGVRLKLKNGSKLLIGSQRETELLAAIQRQRNSSA